MPVVPTPIDSSAVDLITAAYATDVLAAGGLALTAGQSSVLASLITAASREIIRFCGNRPFALQSYAEIVTPEGGRQDRGEPAVARLARFPVVAVNRCATGRAAALSIRNTSAANQEASVAFAATGDVELDNLAATGLTLSRTASGTVTSATIAWTMSSPYTTIAAVASSINALGGGWSARAATGGTPDLSLLPAAYLVGAREPKDATGAAGVTLDVFAATYTGYSIERSTGLLRCAGLPWGCGFGGYGGFEDWGDSPAGFGWPQVEVRYTAGYATIPENVQLCCAEVVQLMLARLAQDPSLRSETTGQYAWVARDVLPNLSDGARATLVSYKDWTV